VTTARRILVGLILTATTAFVVGVTLERHESHSEAAETPAQRAAENPASGTTSEHSEAGESGKGGGESAEHSESGDGGESPTPEATSKPNATTAGKSTPTKAPTHPEASEELLGVNPESTVLLVVAVVASLLLAAGVWWLGASPIVLGIVALAMAAFGALDVREVVHQADESRTGLMLLAALVAVLHFAAAALAARAAVAARDTGPPAHVTT
jgi:hypothetical protein